MNQPILTASNLCYRRQSKQVLKQCHLKLIDNEVVALIGANGTGKTTLLHLLAGIKKPDKGQINWATKPKVQCLGYLPDRAPLYPSMKVDEFLRYCAYIRGLKDVDKSVDNVINKCDLTEVVHQRCASLSHGYQQRVGLAQAIIHQPKVILLDEPTNGLDYGQKKTLRPLLADLGKSASVLMISHDYEEVIATANRVYLLQSGKVHELLLPAKEGLWWLSLSNAPSEALPFTIVIDEGQYVALDKARYTLTDIYKILHQFQLMANVQTSYPVAALQMRIEHVV